MIDALSYWKLKIYEQVSLVSVEADELIVVLGIDDLEPITYAGTIEAIALSINVDGLAQAKVQNKELEIKTYGIPYYVDSPSVGVKIHSHTTEDFVLVFAPTVARHKQIGAYHQELFKAITGQALYPNKMDWVLYPAYRQYYKAVFKAMGVEIDSDRLSFKSRHEFLIATEPIFLEKRKVHAAGISGLGQLMGFTVSEEEPIEEPKEDTLLSAITGAILTFKGRAGWVCDRFSLVELSEILTMASDRIQAANDEMDRKFGKDKGSVAKLPKLKAEPEPDEWKAVKGDVGDKLKELGVALPKGF